MTAKRGSRSARRSIWERDEGICQLCFLPVAFDRFMHIDHLVPVHVGGCSHPENLRTAHQLCNLKRKDAWTGDAHCPLEPGVRRTLRVVGSSRGLRVEHIWRSFCFEPAQMAWLDAEAARQDRSVNWLLRQLVQVVMDAEQRKEAQP